MPYSNERILTTHAGSFPRPREELFEMIVRDRAGASDQ